MKNNLRKLSILLKLIDISKFYGMSVSAWSIMLQGKFDSNVVLTLKRNRFLDTRISDNGFIVFTRGNITITLTD